MDNEFKILSNFLQQLEADVEGRQSRELSRDEIHLLQQLSVGKLHKEGRDEAVKILIDNRTAMEEIVRLLKKEK